MLYLIRQRIAFHYRLLHPKNLHPFWVYHVLCPAARVAALIPLLWVVVEADLHSISTRLTWLPVPIQIAPCKCHRINRKDQSCNLRSIYRAQLYDTTLCGVADSARQYRRRTNGFNIDPTKLCCDPARRTCIIVKFRINDTFILKVRYFVLFCFHFLGNSI